MDRYEKEQFNKALQVIKEQQMFIDQVQKASEEGVYTFGLVVVKNAGKLIVSHGGNLVETASPRFKVNVGDTVKLNQEGSIVEASAPLLKGNIYLISKVLDNNFYEIIIESNSRVVFSTLTLTVNERVVLDDSNFVIIESLGKDNEKFSVKEKVNVSFNDIGGLHQAKKEMINAIESPIKYKKIYDKYRKKRVKGMLLYGPPGCGKTMLAKAAATSMAKLHAQGSNDGFIYVKGPELLNEYVGKSEANVRELFSSAREFYKNNGYPAVIFIDEAEALLSSRKKSRFGMEKTIVPMFLAEMDGLEESGAMVLLSSNLPDELDEAIIRDGRIDKKIKIDRPDKEASKEIFALYLKDKPVDKKTSVNELALEASEKLFAYADVPVSGALIAAVVETAASLAIDRDIENDKFSGININDMNLAVHQTVSNSKPKV